MERERPKAFKLNGDGKECIGLIFDAESAKHLISVIEDCLTEYKEGEFYIAPCGTYVPN